MSFNNNLIDFNGYSNDFTDLDAESPDHHLNMNELIDKDWPDKQGNFDTSPILDAQVWKGFNTDHDGVIKLVSSEEDLICSSPEQEKGNKNNFSTENWEKDFPINFINHSITQDMDSLADGFASNEVITIGDFNYDEENESSPESHNKTMADRWSSNDYNTVLRINNMNDKKVPAKNNDKDIHDMVTKNPESNSNIDENSCASCNEKVYITERLVIDNILYHRQCFKCTKCRRILSMNNFAASSGRLYCKPHFLELFRQSGKYDELDRQLTNNPIQISMKIEKEFENGTTVIENTHTDELPPPQITRNIVEKFRLLESTMGAESLLPRQLSCGQQNTKCYQSTVISDNLHKTNDRTDDVIDELPTPGITKNLLSLWNNIETKSIYSSDKSASSVCGTPKKSKFTSQHNSVSFQSFDVVRHDDSVEDNYPAPNTAKSLAAKFKGEPPMPIGSNQSQFKINRSSSVNRNVLIPNNVNQNVEIVSSSTPNDDWLQSRISNPNQGSENNPVQRTDLISSESKTDMNEFPEQGITRNLVGLFQSMEVKR